MDKRLDDVHQLWHDAEENYFDADRFRISAQSAIQALRSVTFIVQKHKSRIPNFDAWYAPWQERLRSDPLMRWMVDARNRIEKEGDLEHESFVRAEVVASYLDEGPGIQVSAKLFQGVDALLSSIPQDVLQHHVLKHGALRIERRWVESSLSHYEVLEAIATAYERLSELVYDAHVQIASSTVDGGTCLLAEKPASADWRPPCMIGAEGARTLVVSLSTGERLSFDKRIFHIDEEGAAAAVNRYGADALRTDTKVADIKILTEWLFGMARVMFEKDGYHEPLVFLVRGAAPVKILRVEAASQADKYLLMREVANEVAREHADAVVSINEVWLTAASELKPFQRAGESDKRQEALVLMAVSKDEDPLEIIAIITRQGGVARLGENSVLERAAPFIFAPIYRAWNREIPEDWLEMVRRCETSRADN